LFDAPTCFYDLNPTNKGLYEKLIFGSNFDRITIKLGITSVLGIICPVALSYYTTPTACVGKMPKNLPSGQIISSIQSYWADLYIKLLFLRSLILISNFSLG
jgi:hypothetical protein